MADQQGWKISGYFRKYKNIEISKISWYFWYFLYFRYFPENENF